MKLKRNKVVVADTSPLIALACIEQIELLNKLMGNILIPPTVAEECLVIGQAGTDEIRHAIKQKIIKIETAPKIIPNVLINILDKGEAEAITLAKQLDVPIFIDEKLGRRVAKTQKLCIIGTGGLLVTAKKHRLITKVKPYLSQLKNNGYYLSSNLTKEILRFTGE